MRRVVSFLDAHPLIAELMLLPLASAIVWLVLGASPSKCLKIRRAWRQLAAQRNLSVLLVGLLSFGLQAAAAGLAGVPAPTVHDEFCYLLAGDTFAHGRVANPPHALWEHFESFHLIQQPTYAPKYPPMQGLFLAVGQLLGHPILGVWLSMALANAAVCWMLQQWLPARWALLGGLLPALHPRIFWAWGQTYMGGAAALLGGALVFGAARAIFRRPAAIQGIGLGVGLVILANSRPFEGFLLSIPVALLLIRACLRDEPPALRRRILPPLVITLGIAFIAMGYYHWRVTGDPLRMPYQEHEDQYSMTPIFLWQDAKPAPDYRHQVLKDFHAGWAMQAYHARRSLDGFVQEAGSRLKSGWEFFLGPLLTVPLLMLPCALKQSWMRLIFGSALLLMAGLAVGMWFAPHYAAPLVGPLFILIVQGCRILRAGRVPLLARKQWHTIAQALIAGVLLSWLILFALSFRAHLPSAGYAWPRHRTELLSKLEQDGERHLIIVRYGPRHSPHCEWVYNQADIDGARVVWARDMGLENNERLLDYFHDRRVWLLEVCDDTLPPEGPHAEAQRRRTGSSARK